MERRAVFRVNRDHVDLKRKKGSTLIEKVYLPKKYVEGSCQTYALQQIEQAEELQVELYECVEGKYQHHQCSYFGLYGYSICFWKGEECVALEVSNEPVKRSEPLVGQLKKGYTIDQKHIVFRKERKHGGRGQFYIRRAHFAGKTARYNLTELKEAEIIHFAGLGSFPIRHVRVDHKGRRVQIVTSSQRPRKRAVYIES